MTSYNRTIAARHYLFVVEDVMIRSGGSGWSGPPVNCIRRSFWGFVDDTDLVGLAKRTLVRDLQSLN